MKEFSAILTAFFQKKKTKQLISKPNETTESVLNLELDKKRFPFDVFEKIVPPAC